ncbi:S1C family serine protease [Streptomyces sp. NPDC001941]|uniref:S1C family serine protease n=1 Tax=Streptomyces sp. NPDC001941 TaxID=3154659 RepID=UPI0033276D4B
MGRGDRTTLVRICDLAGRPRGTGFLADDRGTVLTSHEAVDGLARVVLHAPGERTCLAGADAVTALPGCGLALVRTEGLGGRALPVAARTEVAAGAYVRLPARGWREARVLGPAQVTYTATDRFHLLPDALELAIGTDGAEALRLGGDAAGGPVVDAATGAVIAVLGTAFHGDRHAAGFAVPLAAAAARDPDGPLAELLRHNAATVPAYGEDLNLAGVLELTATTTGAVGGPSPWPDPVERPDTAREFASFTGSGALVCALAGEPGTGRTTELTALAARRARGPAPAPTLWLRGADLRPADASLACAVARALGQAGRIIAASGARGDMAYAGPERVARLARQAGRPLLVLLDGPEEMPPVLAHRLPSWTAGTERWLRACGAKLVVACRPEHWEQAGALYPADVLHRPGRGAPRLPPALAVGDLPADAAERARARYGLPEDALARADARHPLALRLLAEVREALPERVPGRPTREEVFAAHLDLVCLRVAVRVAAASRPAVRGTAVRRLAARVAGQVHEAARRCLGPGQGELDRESFEEVFPWRTGWAPAVLTEGLLVPAGTGYRFAHEELADWVQGAHLDLDAALHALVHRWHEGAPVRLPSRPGAPRPAGGHVPPPPGAHAAPGGDGAGRGALPVPRHRVGPVLQALLLLERESGPSALARRLTGLVEGLDRLHDRCDDAAWWGARLLGGTLLRLPEPRTQLPVLRLLADRVAVRGPEPGPYRPFGPWFWRELRLGEDDRLDLLRRLVPADAAPGEGEGPRYLDLVAELLAGAPRGVQPLLCRWFGDARPLPATPDATVAAAAQALLYARRGLAVDDLCEALVATAHPRADELLAALAEDEPSALCRAVDRWAHDDGRPERRVAAAAYGPLVARHVTTDADRELLRYAALALLSRPGDPALHGPALALLVRDPATRSRHLPRALAGLRTGEVPATALAAALTTHPEPVLAAFHARLRVSRAAGAQVLDALAEVRTPALARRAAALVREYVEVCPEGAEHAAGYVDRRLEHGPSARAVLFPLVTGLLRGSPVEVRRSLAPVLAAPGTRASRPLRAELLDVLLEHEQYESRDLAVLDALLRAAALGCERRAEARTRDLVHRTGVLLVRTPEGAGCFDRRLVELAGELPAFAALLLRWLDLAPQEWAALVGPGARRTVETLVTPMPMRAAGRGHGSLRPA